MIVAIGRIIAFWGPFPSVWKVLRGAEILALGLLLTAASCGPSYDYNGTWIGYRDLKPKANEDPSAIRSVSKIELTIKPDGTFELFQTGIPKSGSIWFGDGGARLDVRFIAERSLSAMDAETAKRNKTLLIKPLEDGSLEFVDPGDFDPRPIQLLRKPKP